jgi:hypothetical protein
VRVNLPMPLGDGILEVVVDRPWVPKLVIDGSEDARELGIALEDVELSDEPAGISPTSAWAPWTGILARLRSLVRAPASP